MNDIQLSADNRTVIKATGTAPRVVAGRNRRAAKTCDNRSGILECHERRPGRDMGPASRDL